MQAVAWLGVIVLVFIQRARGKAPTTYEPDCANPNSDPHEHTLSREGWCDRERDIYSTCEHGTPEDSGNEFFLLVCYPISVNSPISFPLLLTTCFKIVSITIPFEYYVCELFCSVTSEIACLVAYLEATIVKTQLLTQSNQYYLNVPKVVSRHTQV